MRARRVSGKNAPVMHPILFRIPLPNRPLKLWWALVAVAAIAAIYGLWSRRRNEKSDAMTGLVIAAAAGFGAYYFRATELKAENIPIYSYGVMLGLSLVVGWYITLPLAEKDGLDRETMANCYVITALAALVGSRLLYIATNSSQFDNIGDWFALRRGGLVAYGGFLGGFLGSWAYLRSKGVRLLPWADVAVPSLAAGLMITRIGCYLFGCDFGTRLGAGAPSFLQKLGTFPHLADGTLGYDEKGNAIIGSPAYAHHLAQYQSCRSNGELNCIDPGDHSFPVHPTQLYEALIGLALVAFLLWARRHQKFRGQIFFLFAVAYGFLRFILELWRDDAERGDVAPRMDKYILVGIGLALFAIAFTFGPSLSIPNPRNRTIARAAAFIPVPIALFVLRTKQFESDPYNLSTSQFIGLITALVVAYFYAKLWENARKNPAAAMAVEELSERTLKAEARKRRLNEDEDGGARPKKKGVPIKGKKPVVVTKKAPEPVPADVDDDEDEDEEDEDAADEEETVPAPAVKPIAKPVDEE
ncbi:hypothetical protein BH09MYX1_BH09MYX1_02300 [soil metagenome]